ncbi:MAG: MFS transporter [Rhodospirillales bacterium]|nr:MFS transporter [Rhodospirillales bacterium]
MPAALAPVTALLLSVALLLMGNGLQGTLLPVRAQLEFFSTLDIGVLGSSYFLGFAAGCYLGPYVVRRAGHIRTFTAMVSLASAVALAHALVLDPFVWWFLRALTGFCFAVLYMVIESWLNEKSTNENRGFVFSIYTIINLTVVTVGQMMLTLGSPTAFPLFAVASILVSLAALPVALTNAPAPAPIATVQIRVRRLYQSSPVGFAGALAVGLANGSFWSLAPVFAQSNIFIVGTTGIALFMSTAVIAGAAGQWPLGRLSDKIDRRKVIVITCAGAALSGIGMSIFSDNWEQAVFVFSFLFGIFAFPLYSLCAAHMNDAVETGGFVEASSGLLLLYATGAVFGPLMASATMRFTGPEGLFLYTSAVHAVMAIFAVYRMRQRARPPEEAREPFADSIRVAQTVATLDPLGKSPEGEDSEQASAAAAS